MGSCEGQILVEDPWCNSRILSIEEAGKQLLGDTTCGGCRVSCSDTASEQFMDGGKESVEQSACELSTCVEVQKFIGSSLDEHTMTGHDAMALCPKNGVEAAAVPIADIGLGSEVGNAIIPLLDKVPDIECSVSRMGLLEAECKRGSASCLLNPEVASLKNEVDCARVGGGAFSVNNVALLDSCNGAEIAASEGILKIGSKSVRGSPTLDQDFDAVKSIKEMILLQPNVSMSNSISGATNVLGSDGVSCRFHDEEKDSGRLGNASVLKFPCDQPSSLRRSSRTNKNIQKPEEKAATRKHSRSPSKLSYPDGVIDLCQKTARWKRSQSRNSTRSSGWGLMTNLLQYFDHSFGATMQDVPNPKSRRLNGNPRSRKPREFQAATCSKRLEMTNSIPAGTKRLKVIFGKKPDQSTVQVVPALGMESGNCSSHGDKVSSGDNIPESVLISTEVGSSKDKIAGEKLPQISPDSFTGYRLEEQATCQNDAQDGCSVGEDDDFNIISENLAQTLCTSTLQTEFGKCSSNGQRFSDADTSPDSEVINNVSESQLGPVGLEVLHNSAVYSHDCIANGKVSNSSSKTRKNSSKKDMVSHANKLLVDDCVKIPAEKDKSKVSKMSRKHQKKGTCNGESCSLSYSSGIASISEHIPVDSPSVSNKNLLETVKLCHCSQTNVNSRTDAHFKLGSSWNFEKLLPLDARQQHNVSKSSKSKRKRRNKFDISDSPTTQVETMVKNDNYNEAHRLQVPFEKGNYVLDDEATSNGGVICGDSYSQVIVPCGDTGALQRLRPKNAWVCCDDCDKWRCIPADLADIIEKTNCRWCCKDNHDKAFADCSIPQEKSNTDINAELELSDEEDANYVGSHTTVDEPPLWIRINSNVFLHRGRKTQTVDEVMVCHCKPPRDGRLGCRDDCLNRMLNIECVKGTCPCGDLCSNQQFQKRKYAQLKLIRTGKKGHGLQALEDISQGHFIIEYVGEVLDLPRYEARQRDYAMKGHKHFYFMTLNGNEVIDACAKGNLGRYVNHSCDPNCRTEKWMVDGEICIGLFAIRNIKKGEELTFDYNYVRVFGAAAKKCYCGAAQCRGFIGSDLHDAEVIVQGDSESDNEYLDPVVLYENGETRNALENLNALSSVRDVENMETGDILPDPTSFFMSKDIDMVKKVEKPLMAVNEQHMMDSVKESIYQSLFDPSYVDDLSGKSKALQKDNVVDKSESHHRQEMPTERDTNETPSLSSLRSHCSSVNKRLRECLPEYAEAGLRRPEAEIAEGREVNSKSHPRMKISHSSKSVKSQKCSRDVMNDDKVSVSFNKPNNLLDASANNHFETVEEKLNDLIDANGGICKRKDASKGYLKLLLLTAASGDNGNEGTIQSNRDLSMILDAMLKTKSRGVLVDIINKNGLQMLHNMMKQYRRDFKKIPILRKLLKVLEFLAEKEILTGERINADPRCLGVESLRESLLALTEHQDKKIHQIARSFRDKWIPRVRKISCVDKVERMVDVNRFIRSHHRWHDHETRPSEAIDCTKLAVQMTISSATTGEGSSPQISSCDTMVAGMRKRKSRWDQPADPKFPCKVRKVLPNSHHRNDPDVHPLLDGLQDITSARHEEKSPTGSVQNSLEGIKYCEPDDGMMDLHEDAPPGFSLHPAGLSSPPGFSSTPPEFYAPPGFSIRPEYSPPGFSSPLDGCTLKSFGGSTVSTIPEQNENQFRCHPEVSMGQHQERFNSQLPVAYGIPFSVIQQFGTPQRDVTDGWVVSPGMPFHPFPPLPAYLRGYDKGDRQNSFRVTAERTNESERQVTQICSFPTSHLDHGRSSISGPTTCLDVVPPCAVNQHPRLQGGGSSYNLGKRYFRQQKWKNSKKPPWLRRNGWGFNGNFETCMDAFPNGQNSQQYGDVNYGPRNL